MARPPKLLEKMRRQKAGHRRRDIVAVLEYYGFTWTGEARHGDVYEHPDLAKHPDIKIRIKQARVMVPRGREMPEYVPEDVVESIGILESLRDERTNARD
jgi:hypothetical protein